MTTPLILKRAPIGWNQDDFDVLENGKNVGRIFFLDAVGPQGPPLDVSERPQWQLQARGARLSADARGRDGGVRKKLAAGVVLRSGGRFRFRGKPENVCSF